MSEFLNCLVTDTSMFSFKLSCRLLSYNSYAKTLMSVLFERSRHRTFLKKIGKKLSSGFLNCLVTGTSMFSFKLSCRLLSYNRQLKKSCFTLCSVYIDFLLLLAAIFLPFLLPVPYFFERSRHRTFLKKSTAKNFQASFLIA